LPLLTILDLNEILGESGLIDPFISSQQHHNPHEENSVPETSETIQAADRTRPIIDISTLIKTFKNSLFPFEAFNLVQEVSAFKLVNTDSNVAVCAPTGSGISSASIIILLDINQ
jgi:hypothetical protein